MAILKDLPVSDRRAIRKIEDYSARIPAAAQLEPHKMLRMLRSSLHMTQAQLAKRAGMPQSHIARIEAGKADVQLGTLRKVLGALFCDFLLIPRMERDLAAVLDGRIKEKARENVSRVSGSMALEKQLPEDETLRALIRSEESRLRAHPSSDIWDD